MSFNYKLYNLIICCGNTLQCRAVIAVSRKKGRQSVILGHILKTSDCQQ